MERLSQQTLANLPDDVQLPRVPRQTADARIVHLGIGAFHRAHQAVYTQQAQPYSSEYWHIIGASLRSPNVRNQLAPQDYYYTVVSRDGQCEQYQVISIISDVIVGPENSAVLIEALAADPTRIISLTVTEKGYCHHPDKGELNEQHPDIQHDLRHIDSPRSAPGFIVAALSRRHRSGAPGLTVLSCDNLPDNGRLCQSVILQLAKMVDPDLAPWIERNVSFPSTMVDRIVPASSAADRKALAQHTGLEDQAMVVCEPFSQWVIEDDFVVGRPAWDKAGALLVEDVTPFEQIKLRLLNGSHSSMAYLGILCGLDYLHEVIADRELAAFITLLMDEEISPTLTVPTGFNLEAYKVQLRQRFANSALQHRTIQVAMDGSQKLPQRLLQPLRQQLDSGGSVKAICFAVAAWMQYVSSARDLDDPLADDIKRYVSDRGSARHTAMALLQLDSVFGDDLPRNQRFVDSICYWLAQLREEGTKPALARFLASSVDPLPGA